MVFDLLKMKLFLSGVALAYYRLIVQSPYLSLEPQVTSHLFNQFRKFSSLTFSKSKETDTSFSPINCREISILLYPTGLNGLKILWHCKGLIKLSDEEFKTCVKLFEEVYEPAFWIETEVAGFERDSGFDSEFVNGRTGFIYLLLYLKTYSAIPIQTPSDDSIKLEPETPIPESISKMYSDESLAKMVKRVIESGKKGRELVEGGEKPPLAWLWSLIYELRKKVQVYIGPGHGTGKVSSELLGMIY
jgi:hypothetical protein